MRPIHQDSQSAPPASPPGDGARKRIFLVEDHPLFRRGLRLIVENTPDLTVSGEAASATEALEKLRTTPSDAALIDLSLPGARHPQFIATVRAEHPALPLLALSYHEESEQALPTLRAGANGYLTKVEEPRTIVEAIRSILAGETVVSAGFKESILFRALRGGRLGVESDPTRTLSARELQILQLLGQGQSSRQIAAELGVSVKTVESHRLHVKAKLGLANSAELVHFATQWAGHLAG